MSINKATGNVDAVRLVETAENTPTGGSPAQPASQHHAAHFKGALFRQPGLGTTMRRGPIARMPLRNAGGKRATSRSRPAAGGSIQDDEFDHATDEQGAGSLQTLQSEVRPQSGQDHGRDDSEGGQDRRRFQAMFQPPGEVTERSGMGQSTQESSRIATAERTALPPMHSLHEVVAFIHATACADPSGASMAAMLRRINAAVLRNEIRLPDIKKVADARAALIDVFGTGHDGSHALSGSLRSVNAMLPLWLVNLGKQRSAMQRAQAAAAVSVPRQFPKAGRSA